MRRRVLRSRPGFVARRRGDAPLAVALVLALALVLGPAAGALAGRLLARQQTPAQGHAQVVAQGVAPMPAADTVVWRISGQNARVVADAPFGPRDLGFVVADEGPIVVSDEASGDQVRLGPGEATLVRAGTAQRRASTGDEPFAYYAVELVPADAADEVGSGTALPASDPFAPPAGHRDLDLVRDVLEEDEEASLPAGEAGAPTAVLVTAGTVQIETGDGVPLAFQAGDAAAFDGALTITASGAAGGAFVAATIGAEVEPLAPRPSPSPEPAVGSIAVATYACAEGVTADTLEAALAADEDTCLFAADVIGLVLSGGELDEDLTLDDAEQEGEAGEERFVWADLPFATYTLTPEELAPGYGSFSIAESDQVQQVDDGYDLTLDAENPDLALDLYVFQDAAAAVGSIGFRVSVCPPGATVGNFDPAECEPIADGFDVALTGPAIPDLLSLDDTVVAAEDPELRVFADLPFGEYVFAESELPPGVTAYFVPGSAAVAGLEDGSGYSVTIDETAPDIILEVYNFTEGDGAAPSPAPSPAPSAEPSPPPPPLDSDGDGLPDADEAIIGTDPFDPDTDDDGLSDATEIDYSNAFDPDTDNDGLGDAEEGAFGTSPLFFDTDGDGVNDGAEVANGTSPTDPSSF